jgi:hypothetical protein
LAWQYETGVVCLLEGEMTAMQCIRCLRLMVRRRLKLALRIAVFGVPLLSTSVRVYPWYLIPPLISKLVVLTTRTPYTPSTMDDLQPTMRNDLIPGFTLNEWNPCITTNNLQGALKRIVIESSN